MRDSTTHGLGIKTGSAWPADWHADYLEVAGGASWCYAIRSSQSWANRQTRKLSILTRSRFQALEADRLCVDQAGKGREMPSGL